MKPWHLGNTTVRSPFRLRDGLVALASSPMQGNIRGVENEKAFIQLLSEHDVITVRGDVTFSVGRKWRSALEKLGFIYPDITPFGIAQDELGALDTITPNGWRLIQADPVPAIQECFLRSLAGFYIPVETDAGLTLPPFSPLRHTLAILLELEAQTGDSRLNFIEMALVVQLSNSSESTKDIVSKVLALRKAKTEAVSKRKFDQEQKENAAATHGYAETTFNDYADTNFRYLKATGLVQTKGRGISIVPERKVFIQRLVADTSIPNPGLDYYQNLTDGSPLPTDDIAIGFEVLQDLINQIHARGVDYHIPDVPLVTAADISAVRHQVEDLLFKLNERDFAHQQANEWQEIIGFMDLLINRRKSAILETGIEIEVPQSEAPAYFEWILWRAFLAINSLVNEPYDARRFKIDQDFLPVGCAPGGGPDLIFEFEDFVLVGEVTLTDNSRQEAAEGEPVRRHVADLVSKYPGKSVYGLFMANKIDSNTAETFRIGVWYNNTDQKMTLDIIPITLKQFRDLFFAIFSSGAVDAQLIKQFLDSCTTSRAANEAPAWKLEIDRTLTEKIAQIRT